MNLWHGMDSIRRFQVHQINSIWCIRWYSDEQHVQDFVCNSFSTNLKLLHPFWSAFHWKLHSWSKNKFVLLKQCRPLNVSACVRACTCPFEKSREEYWRRNNEQKIQNENSYKAKLHGNKHYWARSWSVNISESNTFVRKIRNRGYCLKCYWPIAVHTHTHTHNPKHTRKNINGTHTCTRTHSNCNNTQIHICLY